YRLIMGWGRVLSLPAPFKQRKLFGYAGSEGVSRDESEMHFCSRHRSICPSGLESQQSSPSARVRSRANTGRLSRRTGSGCSFARINSRCDKAEERAGRTGVRYVRLGAGVHLPLRYVLRSEGEERL